MILGKSFPGIDPTFWDIAFGDSTAVGHGLNSLGMGEISLVMGIIYNAVQDLHHEDIHKRKWAHWWIHTNTLSYPHFCFLDCCQHLGIDPEGFRLKLKQVGAVVDDGETRPTWRTPAGRKNIYPASKGKGVA